jgi:hypothetical protein
MGILGRHLPKLELSSADGGESSTYPLSLASSNDLDEISMRRVNRPLANLLRIPFGIQNVAGVDNPTILYVPDSHSVVETDCNGKKSVRKSKGGDFHRSGCAVFHIDPAIFDRVFSLERKQAAKILRPSLNIEEGFIPDSIIG